MAQRCGRVRKLSSTDYTHTVVARGQATTFKSRRSPHLMIYHTDLPRSGQYLALRRRMERRVPAWFRSNAAQDVFTIPAAPLGAVSTTLMDNSGLVKQKHTTPKKPIDNQCRSECPVCFNNLTFENVGIFDCGHGACLSCAQLCVKHDSKCPMCRTPCTAGYRM
eukprot:6921732-Prymnesium_polylepis.1